MPYAAEALQSEYDDSDDAERALLATKIRALQQIQAAKALPVSAASLGWFTLWAQHFQCLRASLAGFDYESEYVLGLVNRTLMELSVRLVSILAPLGRTEHENEGEVGHRHGSARPKTLQDVKERLRAYCAWLMCNELALCKEMLSPDTVAGKYDPEPARHLANLLGDNLERWQQVFGEFEIRNDAEAELDKRGHRKYWEQRRSHVLEWISDLDVTDWAKKIWDVDPATGRTSRKRIPAFSATFDPSQGSMRRAFQGTGVGFARGDWSHLSMVMHGSSLFATITIGGEYIAPFPVAGRNSLHESAEQIAGRISHNLFGLQLMLRCFGGKFS
jgi:hypothetical protein